MHLSNQDVIRLRLRAQALSGPPLPTVAAVVERLVGVQAQEEPAARLAIRPRSAGLTAADVEQARVDERTIVHTWAIRSTLHFVAIADLGWILSLLGPPFVRGGQRRRKQLGIDGAIGETALRAIHELLAEEGALTRADLATGLAARGIPTEGQAIYHLIGRAALEGILCAGAPRDGEHTYVLIEQWARVELAGEEEDLSARLAHRYLQGYGPVTVADFAHWSGLPLRQARAAFAANRETFATADVEGTALSLLPEQQAWLGQGESEGPLVHLLPGYDAYLLGYRSRDRIVAPEHARQIHPGGGVIRSVLLVDGWAAGTWRLARRAARTNVVVTPFRDLALDVLVLLQGEVADLGRFLGEETALVLET
jgi:hypothetical protein